MNPERRDTPESLNSRFDRPAPGLNLLLADREGALVRLLGLIERRGFRLGTISTHPTTRGTRLSLTLASDDRPADVLLRQVSRLHDVLEAALEFHRQPHTTTRAVR